MKYIIRIFVLPFLLIGYLLYFLYWRINVILSAKIHRTKEWESKFIFIFFWVILYLLLHTVPWVCLSILIHDWGATMLSILTLSFGIGPVARAAIDRPDDKDSWLLSDIFCLMTRRNPLVEEDFISPLKDPDYEFALKEVNEMFPGKSNEMEML